MKIQPTPVTQEALKPMRPSAYPKQISAIYVRDILGNRHKSALLKPCNEMANILGVTEVGGALLQAQVDVSPAKERDRLEITGSAEPCMQESCRVALRLAKHAFLGSEPEIPYWDVHVHLTEASVYKDGASAGVMIYFALISEFLQKHCSENQVHPYTIHRFRVHPPPIVSTISAFSIKGRPSRYEIGVLFAWSESVDL